MFCCDINSFFEKTYPTDKWSCRICSPNNLLTKTQHDSHISTQTHKNNKQFFKSKLLNLRKDFLIETYNTSNINEILNKEQRVRHRRL
jgi:hypothetical protein